MTEAQQQQRGLRMTTTAKTTTKNKGPEQLVKMPPPQPGWPKVTEGTVFTACLPKRTTFPYATIVATSLNNKFLSASGSVTQISNEFAFQCATASSSLTPRLVSSSGRQRHRECLKQELIPRSSTVQTILPGCQRFLLSSPPFPTNSLLHNPRTVSHDNGFQNNQPILFVCLFANHNVSTTSTPQSAHLETDFNPPFLVD